MKPFALLIALLPVVTSAQVKVTLSIDAGKPGAELTPIYRYFGYDEPNYTYMKDGKRLLGELGKLGKRDVYVRTHNLFTTGDGTPALKWGSTNIYTEDVDGKPVYNFEIADKIIDTYMTTGTKPLMQLGFMPKALSSKPEPYQHKWSPGARYDDIYTGWAYPPKDYKKWGELCFQWAKHCLEKYGKDEVLTWYWEVWNEPNIGYWRGTPQEYHKLYDFAMDGVRRAIPGAKVGGPHVAGGGSVGGKKFMRDFLTHCTTGTNYATGEKGSPVDFVAFHAKGAPRFVDGHVRMGISNQLNDIHGGCSVVKEFEQLKDKPIIIGESDPDGCAACTARVYPQNAYRNGPLFASYTAAAFARKHDIAAELGVKLEGAVTWAFEFEDQPFFDGFRVLSTSGIDLPVLNTFRMMSHLTGKRLPVDNPAQIPLETMRRRGVREAADVHALAALDEARKQVAVMVWHYHDDDVPSEAAEVTIKLAGVPENAKLRHFRIDEEHSNPWGVWKKMGSPAKPSDEQFAQLQKAGQLAEFETEKPLPAELKVSLPRQAVSLLLITW